MIRQTEAGTWELVDGGRVVAASPSLEAVNHARRLIQDPPPESLPPFTPSKLDIE